jgi:beta-glucosidase
LRATIRSGIADPVQPVPDHAVVGNAAHRAIALRAGQEGMILLKNEGSLLPIDPNAIKTIAIIGPRAKNWQYNAHGSPGLTPTVLVGAYNGIAARLAGNSNVNILYASGSDTEGKPIPTEDLITVDGKEHGLHAEYFNNQTLSGNPLITQTDKLVDFDWSNDPRPTGIPPEHFSARWTGNVTAPVSGTYTFSVQVDDGARLWVNNKLLADDWKDGGLRYITGKIDMTAGQSYSLKLEYFQDGGGANASLLWLLPSDGSDPVQRASAIAAQADVAIVIVGGQEETEGTDRSSMDLPDKQDDLIKAIVKANPHTVVVLNNGGPLLVNSWLDDVPSVLDAGFSGELGGDALASILFGDVSPSGKLVDTYGMRREDYPDYGNFPGVKNVVHYNEGIYVGYRAFDKRQVTPQFPFGYGLSYTTFQYSHLKIARNAWKASGNMVVTAEITNTGKRAGAEIAELYIEPKSPLIDRPIRELKGFDRLELAPGQTKTAKFTLTPRDFAYCDVPGKQWRADSGDYVIEVGASSRNLLLQSKVLLTDTWTDPIPGIGAVDPYKAVSSLSTGKPAHDVANAFDEDPSTRWESTWTDPQWLEVDLQQSTTFTHVQIAWETAYSSDFELQVSDDNSTWKTIYTDINGQGGIQQIRFPKVTARYVRLYMNKRASKFGDSIFDFDVFEK